MLPQKVRIIMEMFLNYLPEIAGALIIAIALVLLILWFVRATPAKRCELLDQILYALAIEAERLYGGKTGQAKKKQVVAWFYERYKWLALFVSREKVEEYIDAVVDRLNEWMKSNPIGAANLLGESDTRE